MNIPVLAATAYLLTYQAWMFGTTRPSEGVEWCTDETAARTRLAHLTTHCDPTTGSPTYTNTRIETINN